jgi:DNA-binding NarL/FixJ family response regulator
MGLLRIKFLLTTPDYSPIMTVPKIRVLLADDHPLVLDGLAFVLGLCNDLEVVATAASSDAALTQTLALKPDVVVLDFQLPPKDGAAVALALQAAGCSSRVLLMTGSQSSADIERIFACPAHGAIHKSSKTDELTAAIRALYEGDVYFSDSIAALRQPLQFDVMGELVKLTEREREVLKQVAAGVSSAKIAELLSLQYETVRTHRRNLMLKLGLHNGPQLTAFAIRARMV